jgi:oligoendopeptidase F
LGSEAASLGVTALPPFPNPPVTNTKPESGDATGITWDLSPLMPGGADTAAVAGQGALSLAAAFSDSHRTRIAGYDAGQILAVIRELEHVHEAVTAVYTFASLRFDADRRPPEHGALLSEMEETTALLDALTMFFDLEWIAIEDARAAELLASPELAPYAHLLSVLRRSKPHRLSEPEERMLTEKSVSGVEAWRRLFDEQISGLEVELDGHRIELADAAARLSSGQRSERRDAAAAITAALSPGLRTRVRIFNILLADHAVDDRLRHYPHWLAELNQDNEASEESVQALVAAVRGRYDIPQRWSRIKARALGLDRLLDYDRMAPVGGPPVRVSWDRARELVLSTYSGFSDELGRQAARFFDKRWIDAEIRPGKSPGAYCASTVPQANPFVLLNFSGRLDDVLTLAHELGHGLHFQLAAPRGILQMHTPVTVAETASVFGETLTFAHLLTLAEDPAARFALLAHQLDEAVGTVFRQVAIHLFEDAVHRARRETGELSAEDITAHWMAANRELYGDSVELTENYGLWWSYVSHVFTVPGYVYAYAYGQLLALSMYARYLEEGEPFVPRYLEVLGAGGSRAPQELAQMAGVDLTDAGFWDTGLELIDQRLAQAEAAALEVAS